MTKIKFVATALLLATVATVMPACDLEGDCNPLIEECVFTGNHPDGISSGRRTKP